MAAGLNGRGCRRDLGGALQLPDVPRLAPSLAAAAVQVVGVVLGSVAVQALSPVPAGAAWLVYASSLTERSAETWRAKAPQVAAYRDRWEVTDASPLGRAPDRTAAFAQQADHRRITAALKTPGGQPGAAANQVQDRVRAVGGSCNSLGPCSTSPVTAVHPK